MALFKISKGSKSNLSKQKTIEGYCWFTPEDGKFYIDIAGTAENPQTPVIGTNRICLNASTADYANGLSSPTYANGMPIQQSGDWVSNLFICNSDPEEVEKVCEPVNGGTNIEIDWGTQINVLFINGNFAENPTLTIPNVIEGKYILSDYENNVAPSSLLSWKNGALITLTYCDNEQWVCQNNQSNNLQFPICVAGSNDPYKWIRFGELPFATSRSSYFPAIITQDNTYKGLLLGLRLGQQGLPIYINDAISSATNYTLPANLYLVFYDATDHGFHFRTDGKLPGTMDYLPLSAGQEFPLTGPLGLTADVNYGATLPSAGFEGQLFFLEDDGTTGGGPSLPAGGTAGQYLVKNSSTDGDASWKTLVFPSLDYLPLAGGTLTGALTVSATTDATSTTTGAVKISGGLGVAKNIYGNQVYGAVWNDYAEYRICKENFIPGQVVCENGDDTLSISIQRLQPGANIISDTFGFAIGETAEAKCPIAVSGRVLAYPAEPTFIYSPGDPVCAGPNGTVSKMTREEAREYPDRIIGTVSAIPSYEVWGESKVSVNGRIWIKVR